MNCDFIAPFYRLLEYAAFGAKLKRHREYFLSVAPEQGRVLVLGDGDGRFLAKLAALRPNLQIDAYDLSKRMLALTRSRLVSIDPAALEFRIRLYRANLEEHSLGENTYCAVFSHFFLDCFSEAVIRRMTAGLGHACQANASWIISEFRLPAAGVRRWHAAFWLSLMYGFFRMTTGLEVNRLPDYRSILKASGWNLTAEHPSMAELLCSELWTR